MKNAGFFRKLLASILSSPYEKTETGEESINTVDVENTEKESHVSSGIHTEFVSRNGTHFCPGCGWCDEIEVTMKKETWTDSSGKTRTNYYFIETDKKPECPKCSKRSALPLTTGNVTIAVKYLLKALQ